MVRPRAAFENMTQIVLVSTLTTRRSRQTTLSKRYVHRSGVSRPKRIVKRSVKPGRRSTPSDPLPKTSSESLRSGLNATLGYRYLPRYSNPRSSLHTSVLRNCQGSTHSLGERRKMGWQTTFTLSRRAKGCHLVTDEVVSHIRDGLKDVKVLCFAFIRQTSYGSKRSCTMMPKSSRRGCYSSSCSVFIRFCEAQSAV